MIVIGTRKQVIPSSGRGLFCLKEQLKEGPRRVSMSTVCTVDLYGIESVTSASQLRLRSRSAKPSRVPPPPFVGVAAWRRVVTH